MPAPTTGGLSQSAKHIGGSLKVVVVKDRDGDGDERQTGRGVIENLGFNPRVLQRHPQALDQGPVSGLDQRFPAALPRPWQPTPPFVAREAVPIAAVGARRS